jgi:TolA-binding protein
MYSYRLFRRTFPNIDTREGIEFVGYQMAKTKDFAASIELLRANAADYPTSASAQFGLGRALQASGDTDGARKAFSTALQIDPQFKKATEGLNALR